MDPIGERYIECPFCHAKTIKAFYWPPSRETATSRAAHGSKTKWYRVPERWEIASGCSKCGKTLKEVKREFKKIKEGGARLSHEEIIRRAKEAGLSLKIKG